MDVNIPGKPHLRGLPSVRRKPVILSQEALIKTSTLRSSNSLPLVVEPAVEGVDLIAWAESNRDFIESNLGKHGGVLFRGFDINGVETFERFTKAISTELLEYSERSSPRSQVSGKIYTSTNYPARQSIFLHNENSYQQTFPMKIIFYCQTPADTGGETPIADCRNVFQRIPEQARRKFMDKGWMYVRNFGDGFGLSWQTVFQTEDKSIVEAHCLKNKIQFEWRSGDRLRTRRILPAHLIHPKTGAHTWFNHATFFHVTSLDAPLRDSLLEEFAEEDLPTNTYYGDGSRIEPEVLDELRACYREEMVSFPWCAGDFLLLDNLLVAHGRAPYTGPRKVLVSMAEPTTRD